MMSTRRSGSLPSNNSKRSSLPSDDNHNKPSSPKRQKGESHNNKPKASEPSQAENRKEISSGDPPEVVVTTAAPDVAASISVATPVVPEAAAAAVLEKKPRSLASWKEYQGYESTSPWCRLLTVSPQNPTVSVYTTNFLVGSSQHANLVIKDQKISAILCSIRLAQKRTSWTSVQRNGGRMVKKMMRTDLKFYFLSMHALHACEKTMSIRRTLEEKEETYNTSLEEARNLLGIARDQLKGILEQQEMLDFDSENKKRRLNSWSEELNKCEAALIKENTKIRDLNGTIRCPFCVGKGEQYNRYTHLLQHATRVAESLPQSAKQRAEEAEPPPQTMMPSSAAEFIDDLTGFKHPKKLQKFPEVCGQNGEECIDQSTSPGPSNYGWFARDVVTSEGLDVDYLPRKGTLKNISDNYMNLLETETKKLRCIAEGILEEQETLNLELERKRHELDSRSKELDKREAAFIERERQKLKDFPLLPWLHMSTPSSIGYILNPICVDFSAATL